MRVIGVAVIAVLISGCALEPTQRAQRIQPAYPEMVSKCAFLGGVSGKAPLALFAYGRQNAKYQALDQAAQLGATHVVWEDLTEDPRAVAQARAYYCEPRHQFAEEFQYMDDYLRLYRYPYDSHAQK